MQCLLAFVVNIEKYELAMNKPIAICMAMCLFSVVEM